MHSNYSEPDTSVILHHSTRTFWSDTQSLVFLTASLNQHSPNKISKVIKTLIRSFSLRNTISFHKLNLKSSRSLLKNLDKYSSPEL